ncbi:MAG TPA: type IV toxin-antitoxin system AbiEi family antitoxin domain-containing protein [Solirubrobacterales bacterium]|nr:type IV toxin-antitoxin system AbiEi family antitoxin domain-containing protein [Solirubrobacterales bacterium]
MAAISLAMRTKWQPREDGPGAHGALAALADRQHGVVSIRQLEGPLGYSHPAISRAAGAGRLHRLYTGVYAVGYRNLSPHGQCLAAVLACGPDALLSHYSAAWLWSLTRHTQPVPIHVTSPVQRRKRQPLRLHRARNLTAEDRALENGIPVTSVPRTLLDMAALVKPDWLGRMLERAEELELLELGPVESVIARNRGHRGSSRLRRAIVNYRPPAFTRSDAEKLLLGMLADAGLPRPATGWNECGHELDFYWPDFRFAVELDFFETHGTREAFERDPLRDEDLALAGIETRRVTGRRLEREPAQVVERLGLLLERAEARSTAARQRRASTP